MRKRWPAAWRADDGRVERTPLTSEEEARAVVAERGDSAGLYRVTLHREGGAPRTRMVHVP